MAVRRAPTSMACKSYPNFELSNILLPALQGGDLGKLSLQSGLFYYMFDDTDLSKALKTPRQFGSMHGSDYIA